MNIKLIETLNQLEEKINESTDLFIEIRRLNRKLKKIDSEVRSLTINLKQELLEEAI